MSAADDAYAEAQRLIAKAKASSATKLDLSNPTTRALTALPPEVGALTALTALDLGYTKVTDLAPLTQLTALTSVDLRDTQVTDINPLTQLTALIRVDLRGTPVTDITPLARLTALATLSLSSTQVSNVTPLTQLTALTTLDLRGTEVTDLAPLSQLTALTRVDLRDTQVTDITPLTQLTALTTLSLSSTKVTDLAPLAQLTTLTTLYLRDTQVTDFAPLAQLDALNALYLSGTSVTDLAPLSQLSALTSLDLTGTLITDLKPLTQLTALTMLHINYTPVTDPRPLANLTELATSPQDGGLIFTDTPFAALPEFAGIAEIRDPAERAQRLFAALEGWVPPVPQDSGLAPSYSVPDSGPITSGDDPPEGGDPDQEDMREDLMRKSSLLVAAIGNSNEMAVLKGASEHYQRQIDKPLARIRVGLLYSAANSLRVAYEADLRADQMSRLNDLLPPDVAAPLKDLVETHALFFMGFPNAAKVHQTMLAGLTGGRDRAMIALAEPIVQAFDGKSQVLDPEDQAALADDLAGAKGEGPSAEIAERRLVARLWNIVGAVGRRVYPYRKKLGEALLSADIIAFILGNQTVIGTFLKSAQGAAAAWFDALAQFLMKL